MKIYNPTNYSYITVVEIPKTEIAKFDMALCQQPRQTLKAYYDSCDVKPAIISNGGFFNMSDGSTVFNYSYEGKIISSNSFYKEGFGTNTLVFDTKDDLIKSLNSMIKDEDTILVKASRSAKFEEIIKEIQNK